MDTLVIVRKIRDAEALAGAGRHDDARNLLHPLLDSPTLDARQRDLVSRKLALLEKKRNRATRIMARTSGDTTLEVTAVNGNARVPRDERPTDVLDDRSAPGVATEVVPRADDAHVPPHERKHRVPTIRVATDEASHDDTRASAGSRRSPRRDTDKPGFPGPPVVDPSPRPVRVTDSVVMPRVDEEVPAPGPGDSRDAEYFAPAPHSPHVLRSSSAASVEDDLRLEVARLREEIEQLKSSRADPTTRKLRNPERSISGSFHIPAAQVNTIVRTAAGTNGIDVHLPSRDEDASDLKVLRRDSVRSAPAPDDVTGRESAARDYIDSVRLAKPNLLRPVALYLGFAATVAIVGWGVYLAYMAATSQPTANIVITATAAGPYRLGTTAASYPQLKVSPGGAGEVVDADNGWVIRYDEQLTITSVSIPGLAGEGPVGERFNTLVLQLADQRVSGNWSLRHVRGVLGEPSHPFDEALFEGGEAECPLRYQTTSSQIELTYRGSQPQWPVWIHLRASQ